MIQLYDYFRSSACFRVRIALNLKQLDFTAIPVHLINHGGEQHSQQYSQVNPQELVPSLVDGQHVLTQSLAIIEYLNEIHPTPPLLPAAPYEKALARSFALAIAADIHPLNNLRVLQYLSNQLSINDEQKSQWYQHWIHKGFAALETLVANRQQDFCFGTSPSIADICLVPQMFNARRFGCDLTAYPNLVRIDANCQQLDAFKQAWPAEATT